MSTITKLLAVGVALTMAAPLAFAEGLTANVGANVGVQTSVKTSRGTTTEVKGVANGEVNANENSDGRVGTTTARGENKSSVSVQVRALLDAANRDGGIGEEVRDIAHTYASSSARVDEEKQNVENRPTWMTVLVGADYKSLGALRSEVATTQNAINRLTRARDLTTDASVKATLDVQIQALAATASSTDAYIKAHENVFSIFGWFFRLIP